LISAARKRRLGWVALLLPGLLLRSLIPVGFMPMFGPGMSIQLALCESYAPVPAAAMPAGMRMPDGSAMDMGPASSGHGTPSHQDHSACPYAASATVAAASPWYGFALARQRSVAASAGNAQIDHFQLAPRAQSPRAPPALI
jgi:hypothetical protein